MSSSSISKIKILEEIPTLFKDELIEEFNKILRNYRENRWEPAELNGGKFCEIVYSILKGHTDKNFAAKPFKPNNMVDDCKALEKCEKTYSRSIRIQIPRMIIALYEIRNNRGVGHVGGDVNPNHMDATVVLSMCKWILTELIREFHKLNTQEASEIIELITERTLPIVWETNGKKRVLNPKLSYKDKSLLLLYSSTKEVKESELFNWVEHSNASIFRRDILVKLHVHKLVEYDKTQQTILISPIGIKYVEDNLALDIQNT